MAGGSKRNATAMHPQCAHGSTPTACREPAVCIRLDVPCCRAHADLCDEYDAKIAGKPYPNSPGYKTGGASKEAADRIAPYAKTLDHKLLVFLVGNGPICPDDYATAAGLDVLNARPIFSRCKARGSCREALQSRRVQAAKLSPFLRHYASRAATPRNIAGGCVNAPDPFAHETRILPCVNTRCGNAPSWGRDMIGRPICKNCQVDEQHAYAAGERRLQRWRDLGRPHPLFGDVE